MYETTVEANNAIPPVRPYGGFGLTPRFTRHALDRLAERFKRRLSKQAVDDHAVWRDDALLVREAHTLFADADERRQILNDTRFMTYLRETYGYEKRFVFMANGETVFVCVEDHANLLLNVVTVVDSTAGFGSYTLRNMGKRVKFTRRAA